MKQITVGIDGMMCDMCAAHVNDQIRRCFKVESVKADRKKKQAVIVAENEISADDMKKALDEIGYTFTGISVQDYQKKKLFGIF